MKRYVSTPEHRVLVEQAMALVDSARRKRRRIANERGHKLSAKRHAERRADRAAVPAGRNAGMASALRQILPLAGWKVLLARMAPGVWYRMNELHPIMPEYARGSVKAWVAQRIPREVGELDRAGNPEFDPGRPARASLTGRYLYRVPAVLEDRAAAWRAELGEA